MQCSACGNLLKIESVEVIFRIAILFGARLGGNTHALRSSGLAGQAPGPSCVAIPVRGSGLTGQSRTDEKALFLFQIKSLQVKCLV